MKPTSEKALKFSETELTEKRGKFIKHKCVWCGKLFDSKTGKNNHERAHPEYSRIVKLVQQKGLTKEEAIDITKLRDCPFCDEVASIKSYNGISWQVGCRGDISGVCPGRMFSSIKYRKKISAMIAWNKRASLQKEDLREWLKGASPLLKPQVGTTIAHYNHKQGYNHLKRELLALLEKEEK